MRRLLNWAKGAVRYLLEKPVRIGIVLAALAVGVVAGLPVQDAGFRYLWVDHRFCNDCHVHDYANEAWERSAHVGLTTCHDCHRVPVSHYPRNLVRTVFPPDEMPMPHVETVICQQCHWEKHHEEPLTGPMGEATRARITKVDDSPLHKVHLNAEREEGEEKIDCMSCHGSELNRAHRFEPTDEVCLECHDEQGLHDGRLAHTRCRDCHFPGFLGKPGVGDIAHSPVQGHPEE